MVVKRHRVNSTGRAEQQYMGKKRVSSSLQTLNVSRFIPKENRSMHSTVLVAGGEGDCLSYVLKNVLYAVSNGP